MQRGQGGARRLRHQAGQHTNAWIPLSQRALGTLASRLQSRARRRHVLGPSSGSGRRVEDLEQQEPGRARERQHI